LKLCLHGGDINRERDKAGATEKKKPTTP